MKSMLDLQQLAREKGWRLHLATPAGESLITRARNAISSMFIADTKYTHLLFLDADIQFNALGIGRLLEKAIETDELVVGCYPKKYIDFDKLIEQARHPNRRHTTQQLLQRSMDYVFGMDVGGEWTAEVKDGFMEVAEAGTGVMLASRKVFDLLTEHHPEKYVGELDVNYDAISPLIAKNFWTFFETAIEDGRYLSEDYAFCKLYRRAGGKIHMDVMSAYTHSGRMHYEGHVMQIFEWVDDKDKGINE